MEYAILGMLILIFIQNWYNSWNIAQNQQVILNYQTELMKHQKLMRKLLPKPTNNDNNK